MNSSHVISHYAILGNRGTAYGRITSSFKNRSSVTEGAAGEKDCRIESATPWDRPVERREVTYGLSYRRLENRIVVKAFLVSAIIYQQK